MKRKYNLLILTIFLVCTLLLASCSSTAQELNRTSTLSISSTELIIEKGEKAMLFAGYDGKSEISYTIPDKDNTIIELNVIDNGVEITALNDGVTYLEVSVNDHRKTCKVIVTTSVYQIEFDRISNSIDIYAGTTHTLKAVVYKNGQKTTYIVEWEVSGPKYKQSINNNEIYLTVDEVGVYKITAKFKDKVVAQYTFNVINEI